MKKTKLTTAGKALIFGLVLLIVAGVTYFAGGFNAVSNLFSGSDDSGSTQSEKVDIVGSGSTKDDGVINVSLDEWIGWKSVIDANGGLETAKGSIYDKLGIKVKIHVINDANQSSNALIKGDLDGAGYTVNRYAFLYPKFKENGVNVVMPYVTNFSSGGDGIISKSDINSVEDLVGKKIAVPRFSEAQTLVEWLLAKSDLSDKDVKEIRKNMVMFDTPDDAAKAFFAGQVDAAATWQPYLSQAQETTGAKLLFSTKVAENIILDGIVFRQDFIDKNKEAVVKFTEGALEAMDLYTKEFSPIKDTMPLFATESNENIVAMAGDAKLASYNENKSLLTNEAVTLFTDMSNIWKTLGETSFPDEAKKAFTTSIIDSVDSKFASSVTADTNKPKFTEEKRQEAKQVDNVNSLLKQSATIEFQPNSAAFANAAEASKVLEEFVKTAQILNGSIIQIEGNVNNTGAGNDEAISKKLSEQRAKAVAMYLQQQGVDATRFVVVGNGTTKQIGDNNTEAGKAQNRRTDVFFKIVE
ncbi:gp249 [Bacillus phage G]|uniref:Gp249 n=1 Tax=Bacillus phage G TaxID=2884420 RepID=G3M9Z0_9CAUD|nr:gp249 [Bacillus phage G]AEO93508.1 gp249 [Bacillus phage G]